MTKIQEFDYSADMMRALLWRNNSAPNITALLQHKQDYFNSENQAFWEDWYTDVFDLRTANRFGLNVWSIILGAGISFAPVQGADNTNWGFGSFRKNFLNGNFTSLNGFLLTPDDARIVLRLRYYQLTTNGNILGLNFMLSDVFGSQGLAFVLDGLDMTITYEFQFVLTSSLINVFNSLDVLPRPAGVSASFTSL